MKCERRACRNEATHRYRFTMLDTKPTMGRPYEGEWLGCESCAYRWLAEGWGDADRTLTVIGDP